MAPGRSPDVKHICAYLYNFFPASEESSLFKASFSIYALDSITAWFPWDLAAQLSIFLFIFLSDYTSKHAKLSYLYVTLYITFLS